MGALDGPGVLAVEVEGGAWVNDGSAAVLAGRSEGAAGNRGEDVVRVHGAEDERRAVPALSAGDASQVAARAFQAAHADRVQVQQLMIGEHLQVAVVPLRGQEERPVDQGVAVVDGHLQRAAHAAHVRHLVRAQVGQHEAARLVVAVRTLVFHLDVVRVLLVSRQDAERREIRPALEDVARCRLLGSREEIKLAFLHQAARGQGRGFCRTWGAAASARKTGGANSQLGPNVVGGGNNATPVAAFVQLWLLLLLLMVMMRRGLLLRAHEAVSSDVVAITYVM